MPKRAFQLPDKIGTKFRLQRFALNDDSERREFSAWNVPCAHEVYTGIIPTTDSL
jgi:hypothetical protein